MLTMGQRILRSRRSLSLQTGSLSGYSSMTKQISNRRPSSAGDSSVPNLPSRRRISTGSPGPPRKHPSSPPPSSHDLPHISLTHRRCQQVRVSKDSGLNIDINALSEPGSVKNRDVVVRTPRARSPSPLTAVSESMGGVEQGRRSRKTTRLASRYNWPESYEQRYGLNATPTAFERRYPRDR